MTCGHLVYARGGFDHVEFAEEVCPCEDFTFYCRDRGLVCRHVYAAAIARVKHRLWLRRVARVIAPILMDDVVEDGEPL